MQPLTSRLPVKVFRHSGIDPGTTPVPVTLISHLSYFWLFFVVVVVAAAAAVNLCVNFVLSLVTGRSVNFKCKLTGAV